MPQPDRPLPECLTRLLVAPSGQATAPGERTRGRVAGPPAPLGDRATDGAIVRAAARGAAGLVWIGILWQALHRVSG